MPLFAEPVLDSEPKNRRVIQQRQRELLKEAVELSDQAQCMAADNPQRSKLYRGIQERHATKSHLEAVLATSFLPAHGANQLISPRVFFLSPLFRVASKTVERERTISLELRSQEGGVLMRYTGPELRQSDGMVFMALLNLARDEQLGEAVSFSVEELCRKVFDRYDGPTRKLLRSHIQRLQRGLLEFDQFSVQLCQRFDYPSRGAWSVRLDKDVVALFQRSSEVWLDLGRRKALPEGLTTWLYGFVESQTKLIPMKAATLRDLCGSEAADESFLRTLRVALHALAEQGVIDSGWSVQGGFVHWMKAKQPLRSGVV